MEFYLQPAFLSAPPAMEITESEYVALANARKVLNAVFSMEENYDLLLDNYLELENSLLSLSAATMLRRPYEYEDMFELTAQMNRRAVNFLSSAKLFLDQIRQRVATCGGNAQEVINQTHVEYDLSFEYRFMEALRNHVQHSGSAIHWLSTGGAWWPRNKKLKQIFALEVHTQKNLLELDPQFKKSTLLECPEKVDFMHAARKYLKSLSLIQDFARSNIKDKVDEARYTFDNAIKKYEEFSKGKSIGLKAFSSSDRSPINKVPILLEWDNVRLRLEKKNRSLSNLDNSIIASEMIPAGNVNFEDQD